MNGLRKIDCVMVQVDDLDDGIAFYARTFGLEPAWRDERSAALRMPETDAEIVLHTFDLPREIGVHYLVDDVDAAVEEYAEAGCAITVPPFDIAVGRCAVLADPYGNPVCVLDIRRRR
jgi:predicted enzyme related to lactoylglutathione lyase